MRTLVSCLILSVYFVAAVAPSPAGAQLRMRKDPDAYGGSYPMGRENLRDSDPSSYGAAWRKERIVNGWCRDPIFNSKAVRAGSFSTSWEKTDELPEFLWQNDRCNLLTTAEIAGVRLKSAKSDKLDGKTLYASLASSVLYVETDFGFGSAVAVANDRFLTNCHVVQHSRFGAPAVLITLTDRNKGVTAARIAESHPEIDICILQTTQAAPRTGLLPTIRPVEAMRLYYDLKVGEPVFAIGNPSIYDWSLTSGEISAVRDNYQMRTNTGPLATDIIQFSAPIYSGSSGGALFDQYGNLVGITSSSFTGTQGFNFAVPVDVVWVLYGKRSS